MDESKIGVGDEVLCVNAAIKPERIQAVYKNFPVWIKEGDKYIVREIMTNDDIVTGITLEGRRNPPIYIPLLKRMSEPSFAIFRFRKTKSAYMIQEEKESEEITQGIEIETYKN